MMKKFMSRIYGLSCCSQLGPRDGSPDIQSIGNIHVDRGEAAERDV
jgi:hypothetical protein